MCSLNRAVNSGAQRVARAKAGPWRHRDDARAISLSKSAHGARRARRDADERDPQDRRRRRFSTLGIPICSDSGPAVPGASRTAIAVPLFHDCGGHLHRTFPWAFQVSIDATVHVRQRRPRWIEWIAAGTSPSRAWCYRCGECAFVRVTQWNPSCTTADR
jgi:hypothetical protein